VKFPVKIQNIQKTPTKFAQALEILNNAFEITLVQKYSKIEIHNALILPIVL
jgi:hypothetical protein